jgi:hypothetical protein
MSRIIDKPIGDLKAENDKLLHNCFLETDLIKKILSFKITKNIVVGKKGSGKSAIFRIGFCNRKKIPTARISPETHSIEVERTDLNYKQYSDLFEYELKLECLKSVIDDSEFANKIQTAEYDEIKYFIGEYLKKIKKILKGIESFSIFGLSLSIKKSEQRLVEIVSKDDFKKINSLFEIVKKYKQRCLLMIDDPELVFVTDRKLYPELLGGLLSATINVNSLQSGYVKVIVFLKYHIYKQLRTEFEDIDQFRLNFMHLKWDREDLNTLFSLRIQEAIKIQSLSKIGTNPWYNLFGYEDEEKAIEVSKYIIDRIICGPRDLIFFATSILESLEKYRNDEALIMTEKDYSNSQLEEIKLEFDNRGYKGIVEVIEHIFSGNIPKSGVFSKENNFEDFLSKRYKSQALKSLRVQEQYIWLEALTIMKLAKLLFEINLVGYWCKKEKRFILPFEILSELRGFRGANKKRINPAFLSALKNI